MQGTNNMGQQPMQGAQSSPQMGQYDPTQLSSLMSAGMSPYKYNQMSGQLQQQWLGQYGQQIMGQPFSPYQRVINQQGMPQTTYTQNGTYSMSPEQLSRFYQAGNITGIGQNGYTTGKMSLNTLPQYITAGSMYNY